MSEDGVLPEAWVAWGALWKEKIFYGLAKELSIFVYPNNAIVRPYHVSTIITCNSATSWPEVVASVSLRGLVGRPPPCAAGIKQVFKFTQTY